MFLSQKQSFEKALAAALCACLLIPFSGCVAGHSDVSSPENPSPAESSSEKDPETEYTFNYSGTDYPVTAVNRDVGGAGFFYFDRTSGAVSAPARNPETEGEYTDLAVCNGILCAVFENTPAVLPETGFVIRVSGKELKRRPEAGISVRSALNTVPYRPEEYVDFGSAFVEVRYRNIVRIDDNAGFLFDEGWYNASTKSNRYGTEIAVGNDGTVVRVNGCELNKVPAFTQLQKPYVIISDVRTVFIEDPVNALLAVAHKRTVSALRSGTRPELRRKPPAHRADPEIDPVIVKQRKLHPVVRHCYPPS